MAIPNHPDFLKLMSWNANSILNKKEELIDALTTHELGVALITETFLKPKNVFKVRNYSVYRSDRVTLGGGTAILINRDLKHHEVFLPKLSSLEANAVVLNTRKGDIRVISVYKSPATPLEVGDLDLIFSDPTPTIVAGDLNCKHPHWNSRLTNSNGKLLFNHMTRHGFSIYGPTKPTHYPDSGKRPDVLDIVITNNLNISLSIDVIQELSSDHNPVIIEVGNIARRVDLPERFNTKLTDWKQFRDCLDVSLVSVNPTIQSKEDVDYHILELTEKLTAALHASTPKPRPKKSDTYDLPMRIRKSIAAKNKLRKLWQKLRRPLLKSLLNKMEADIKKMINTYRNETWNDKLSSLNVSDKSLWQMTKCILQVPMKFPPLHGVNGMAYSNQDKANAMADTLERTFTPNDDPSNIDKIIEVEEAVENLDLLSTPDADIDLCSPSEIRSIASKLNNTKAPGLDGLPNIVFKELSKKALAYLTKIYNSMLKLRYFSTVLKKSKIILFAKPGKDPMFPQNYRPISLLSALCKIFEKLILIRLLRHIKENNILLNEQFGFRQEHSTNHQLLRLTEEIINGFNSKRVTAVVFLDIAQAFDKVWHEGLVFKMMRYNFPHYLSKLIQSYLYQRSFEVHLMNAVSSTRPIAAGVPQGSILGPMLFNIYINDIPKCPHTSIALYADDTAVIAQSMRAVTACAHIQSALDLLEDWYEDWRIKINVTKSNAVLFTRKRPKSRKGKISYNLTTSVSLFEEVIPWAKDAKYLGVHFDSKLSWNKHIQETASKTRKRVGMLMPLLRKKSKLDVNNGLILYKTLILPIMTYAAHIWANTSRANLHKLQTIQNKTTRMISRSPWFVRNSDIHRDLKLPTFHEIIKNLAIKFYSCLSQIENDLIANLSQYSENEVLRHLRPKNMLIAKS